MIDPQWIKDKIATGYYILSKHADDERQRDRLTLIDLETVLVNGSVLEQYPDTGRGESCLVIGFTSDRRPVHVVCGERSGLLVLVTVYVPSPPKFKTPYERG